MSFLKLSVLDFFVKRYFQKKNCDSILIHLQVFSTALSNIVANCHMWRQAHVLTLWQKSYGFIILNTCCTLKLLLRQAHVLTLWQKSYGFIILNTCCTLKLLLKYNFEYMLYFKATFKGKKDLLNSLSMVDLKHSDIIFPSRNVDLIKFLQNVCENGSPVATFVANIFKVLSNAELMCLLKKKMVYFMWCFHIC